MQADYIQRLRLTFEKEGPARYIGHLDLARTMERALNRAHMPLAYTQGFNRRPRLSFAAPLPLGYTSEHELADIWLLQELDPHSAREQMMRKMAPGITIREVVEVPLRAPSLQSLTAYARYQVVYLDMIDLEDLVSRVDRLLTAESLVRERRRGKGEMKSYDLRPLIIDLSIAYEQYEQSAKLALNMTLMLMSGQTGRPDEVLSALGLDPLSAHIHRTGIFLRVPDTTTGPN